MIDNSLNKLEEWLIEEINSAQWDARCYPGKEVSTKEELWGSVIAYRRTLMKLKEIKINDYKDIVEVVRCNKCKWGKRVCWGKNDYSIICTHKDAPGEDVSPIVRKDWFCPLGKWVEE